MTDNPNGHDHHTVEDSTPRVDPRDVICSILADLAAGSEAQQLANIGLSEMYFLGKREAFQISAQVVRNPGMFMG